MRERRRTTEREEQRTRASHKIPHHELHFPLMKDVELHRSILREFGRELTRDSLILDFGCGDGSMVREYRCCGLQALGVDVTLDREDDFLRLIAADQSYRIPFGDDIGTDDRNRSPNGRGGVPIDVIDRPAVSSDDRLFFDAQHKTRRDGARVRLGQVQDIFAQRPAAAWWRLERRGYEPDVSSP